MQIITGAQPGPIRAVIYGPEGIGKSTMASHWPKPLFVDIESGTAEMDVARTVSPESWAAFTATLDQAASDMGGYQTLVVDTADWAEKLLREHVCTAAGVKSIGDKPYGQLYQAMAAEWSRMLDQLTRVSANIVLLAHSQIVHCDIPEEAGSYDRYELKLLNSFKVSLSGMVKEWASLVLFCSYETFVSEGKASGGKRVIHSAHHPCWDAKQRTGMDLPEKMDMPATGLPPEIQRLFVAAPPKQATEPTNTVESELTPLAVAAAALALVSPVPNARQLEQLKQLMVQSGIALGQLDDQLAAWGVVPAGTHPRDYNEQTLSKIITNWTKITEAING